MRKLNEVWVPKSRAERWISIVIVWILFMFLSTAIDVEVATGVLGLFAIAFTSYAITQGTDELKEIDKLNKNKRREKRRKNLEKIKQNIKLRKKQKEKDKHQKKGIDVETGEPVCPNCGSSNINYSLQDVEKERGFFGRLLMIPVKFILFFFYTASAIFVWLINLVFGGNRKRTVKKTFAICQNCGNSWQTKK